MAAMAIGEVAARSGLRPSAIRYYEQVGILPEPALMNGRRRYDPDVLHVLHAIGVARSAGFGIEELRQIFSGIREREAPSAIWQRFAEQKLREVDELILRANAMRRLLEEGLRCGCLGVEECVLFGQSASADSTIEGVR
jgi:MerR family transcriptional regulator, redox-sensitive transcriptional activator SoxR